MIPGCKGRFLRAIGLNSHMDPHKNKHPFISKTVIIDFPFFMVYAIFKIYVYIKIKNGHWRELKILKKYKLKAV